METRYTLTEEGKKYLIRGLPEKTLEEFLKNPAPIAEAKKHMENFSIALMWAKKKGMVKIEAGKLVLTKKPQKHPEEAGLRMVSEGRRPDKKTAETLIRRNLIKEEREDIHRQAQRLIGKEVSGLTPELIKSGYWKSVRLKPYNVVLIGRRTYPGKPHIISFYIEKIRNIFFDAGFREAEGPLVESSFWNFDALYQPQDHPARDLADTFYLKQPNTSRLPAKGLVQNVKKTHENGWNTGSKGWGYMWSEEKSRQPVLRTHTTAVSARRTFLSSAPL